MVMAPLSIFVERMQQISCAICHFVCHGGRWWIFLLVDNLSEFNFATNMLNNETVILLNPVDIARVVSELGQKGLIRLSISRSIESIESLTLIKSLTP